MLQIHIRNSRRWASPNSVLANPRILHINARFFSGSWRSVRSSTGLTVDQDDVGQRTSLHHAPLAPGMAHWFGSNVLGSMDIWSRRPVANTGKRIGLPGKTFCTTESFTTTTPFTNT